MRNPFVGGFWRSLGESATRADEASAVGLRARAAATAPIIWLLGKTGTGKTSIIAEVTGDTRAEIGSGFKACTATSRVYDWPAGAPILRFLDTRGLGEPGYDPTADIAVAEAQAHVLLVCMAVDDPNQQEVVSAVARVRRSHREWPVVVAQTQLHRLYPPNTDHPEQYPYRGDSADDTEGVVPPDLRLGLRRQRELLAGLQGPPARFVPLDFTSPDDGFTPTSYGRAALDAALLEVGVDALWNLAVLAHEGSNSALARRAEPLILGYATTAAGAGAVPVPVVGVGGLIAANGLMFRALAERYGVTLTGQRTREFAGSLGSVALLGVSARYGVRELFKLVPGIGTLGGATLNSVAAFGLTYGVGQAAIAYLRAVKRGQSIDPQEIRRAFKAGLDAAARRDKSAVAADAKSQKPAVAADAESQKSAVAADAESQKAAVAADAESKKPAVAADAESQKAAVAADAESPAPAVAADAKSQKPAVAADAESKAPAIARDVERHE